jgi:lipid A 3-O-deacylase
MFAQYYIPTLVTAKMSPFAELGIGAIYTDFQLKNQGSRVNFNPQLGVGMDYMTDSGQTYFGAVRLQHVSNANLFPKNRGLNSIDFMIGLYF